MTATLTCPGTRTGRHNGTCCISFAAMSPFQRALKGMIAAAPAPAEREHLIPPPPPVTSIAQLTALVAERQRAEAETSRADHDALIVWVEIGDTDREQAFALFELARAYGIVAGWR